MALEPVPPALSLKQMTGHNPSRRGLVVGPLEEGRARRLARPRPRPSTLD